MPYAVVTGASGGIGLCLAKELAARKYDLLLVARSADKLKSLAESLVKDYGVKAAYLSCDLSQADAAAQVLDWIAQNKVDVSVLINNAGYGLWGEVEKADPAKLQNMIRLNVNTLVSLSHGIIPHLRLHTPSYILNVASTAAYQAVPTLSTYAATKAFVVTFSLGLRYELKNTGVHVCCLSPGATLTGFVDRAGMEVLKERADKFSMKPEKVARIAIRGMFNNKAEMVTGFTNWISVKLTYFFPKALIETIAAGLYKT